MGDLMLIKGSAARVKCTHSKLTCKRNDQFTFTNAAAQT